MPTETARSRPRGAAFWLGFAALALLVFVAIAAADWYVSEPPNALVDATYVGRTGCIDCHQEQYADFLGSHHDRAMELATDKAVIGDFDDATFERLGVVTKFFRRGDQYWVNTEGADGKLHDFQVKYTFGIDPLQQYMVEFPDGRVQVLRVSWDTHKKKWFYVPPPDATDQRLEPDDPTHWTGIAQNWNTTCAACHSTDLHKNYNLAENRYDTTFSEIDVSCEACHGPASLHVKLATSRSMFWDRQHGYGLAKINSLDSTPQIEACAKCHSRQVAVHPGYRPGQEFGDYHNPALLSAGLYHADGQILDEVYVYGSFLHSRMHREGVRCTDCHNPHSLKLKFEGNALCAQCHVPAKYDTPAHHHHKIDTPGASCMECHMPATTYMVVDPRRDHGIRVPRPDLTVSIGTPNACNHCHTLPAESPEWAAEKVVEWYGNKRPDDPHWARAIAGGRQADPESLAEIIEAIGRQTTPDIVKATLCELLSQYRSPEAFSTLTDALSSPSVLVRQAAAANYPARTAPELSQAVGLLLSDPVRSVRIAAAVRMLAIPPQALEATWNKPFELALAELKQQLHMSNERAMTHIQLSQLEHREGNADKSAEELRTAIRLEPYLSGPRTELAQLLLETSRDPQAVAEEVTALRKHEITLLERDIKLLPENGDIRYRLGMLHYLLGNMADAEQRLAEAVGLEPRSYQYALGLVLLQHERYKQGESSALSRALETLKVLHEIDPHSPDAENLLRELTELRKSRDQDSGE